MRLFIYFIYVNRIITDALREKSKSLKSLQITPRALECLINGGQLYSTIILEDSFRIFELNV